MVVTLEAVLPLTIVMADLTVDLTEVLMEGMVLLQVPLGHMEVLLVGLLRGMGMVVEV